MQRRDVLRASGLGVLAGVAGCTGLTSSGSDATTTSDGTETASGDQTSAGAIPDHPATANLADQPHYGELGGTLVVAFEDPSCPRCAAFESNTVPKIRSNLVETGKAAFAFRGYPVVYPWGEPAAHALEATYAQSESAHWALLEHYFDTQREFTTDNVWDRTRNFLEGVDGVDAASVTSAAQSGEFDAAVQTDLEAGANADVGQTTPTVLLFKDGEYRTRASGSVSYDLVATALGE